MNSTTMWNKYDYICTDCDALIEITTLSNLKNWRGWCPCGSPNLMMLGYADATVKVSPEYVSEVTPVEVVKINSNPYN
jgi:hypothetical protein